MTYAVIRGGVYERHYLRLCGLDPVLRYRVEGSVQVLSGAALMNAGLCIPETLRDFTTRLIHLTAVD